MNGLARTATGWIAGATLAAFVIVAALGLDFAAIVAGGFIPLRVTEGLAGAGMIPALLTPFTVSVLS